MADKKNDNTPPEADFERKIAELSVIVDKLESDVSLDEGMKLFEKGLGLTEQCFAELETARAGIAELKGRLDIILGRDGSIDE